MKCNPKYRHEYKYICDSMQNAVLKLRANGLLKRDAHSGVNGAYQIRSLYFDDWDDSCYYENESGIGTRDKYRIRIYNADAGRIALERKSKERGMTLKVSGKISETMCRQLMRGEIPQSTEDMSDDLKEMLRDMRQRCMRPAVIVEYLRYPFVERNGNVRVTFDENIRSSNEIDKFLEKEISARPILEKGQSVLEVKWDEFIPDYIKGYLQLDSLRWTSFSKYYLCRRYNSYGGIRT